MPSRTARALCSGRGWVKATRPYRRHHAALGTPCALCHEPINYSLLHPHRRAFTVDHIIPIWAGNPNPLDPTGWQPAHHGCNASRGASEGNKLRTSPPRRRTRLTW